MSIQKEIEKLCQCASAVYPAVNNIDDSITIALEIKKKVTTILTKKESMNSLRLSIWQKQRDAVQAVPLGGKEGDIKESMRFLLRIIHDNSVDGAGVRLETIRKYAIFHKIEGDAVTETLNMLINYEIIRRDDEGLYHWTTDEYWKLYRKN